MSIKLRRNILLDPETLSRIDSAKKILHKKSRNELITEAIESYLAGLSEIPKSLNEAIDKTYGAGCTIKSMRDKINNNFKKRLKRA